MKLIFIRHGDPDYEHDSLTERGWKEAAELAKRVARWNVDKFYCSPLGRARHTARVSLDLIGRDMEIKDWMREFKADILDPVTGQERIPWDLLPAYWTVKPELYDKDRWYGSDVMLTGNVEAEYKRVCDGLDEILAGHGYVRDGGFYRTNPGNDKTLVFFCHLGVEFVMLSHLFGLSAPTVWQNFFVAPSSVTLVCTEERVKGEAYFRCKKLGDTSHLYAAGLIPSDSGFYEWYEE